VWAAIALAFGLAMDATAVSAARGLATQPRELVLLPLLFGGFQSGMAALGWLAGRWAGPYIARWDHWVAFGLLVAIGGKMLFDGWRDRAKDAADGTPAPASIMLYLGLAIATSIDAAAAGLTLPLVDRWHHGGVLGSRHPGRPGRWSAIRPTAHDARRTGADRHRRPVAGARAVMLATSRLVRRAPRLV
jgi:hypothetical protein